MSHLNLKSIDNFFDFTTEIKKLDLNKQSLIVSSQQAKTDLKLYFLKEKDITIGDSIKTFFEFLEGILFSINPNIRIVSSNFIKALIKKNLSLKGQAEITFEFLKLLIPVFSHPNGHEILSEWIYENLRKSKWVKLIDESYEFYNSILKKNITTYEFIPAILFNEDLSQIKLKSTVIYVGSNLRNIHTHILKNLGKTNDLTLICPNKYWVDSNESLKNYKEFEIKNSFKVPNINIKETRRFSSKLSEVKDCVNQIRKWLSYDIRPFEICILSPDIENYLPVLETHLDFEGIGYNSTSKTPLKSFTDALRVISILRSKVNPSKNDLALSLFDVKSPIISYNSFLENFDVVTRVEDYERDKEVFKFITKNLPYKDLNLKEFMGLIEAIWKQIDGDSEILKQVLSRLSQDNLDVKISLVQWLDYFENMLSEIKISDKDSNLAGVGILSLSDFERVDAKKIFMLGMSDQAIEESNFLPLTEQDIKKIEQDIGFILNTKVSDQEFKASWIMSGQAGVILSFSEQGFFSEELSPSYLWIKSETRLKDKNVVNNPQKTRWDLLALGQLEADQRGNSPVCEKNRINKSLKDYDLKKISATKLEQFYKCPFIFYAKNILNLKEVFPKNLDFNFLERGFILHKALKELVKNSLIYKQPNQAEIKQELRKIILEKIEKENPVFEKKYLDLLIDKYTKVLDRVLYFEKKKRSQEKYLTLYKEKTFETYFSLDKKTFVSDRDKNSVKIKCIVDRIDLLQGESFEAKDQSLRIIDYKYSGANPHHPLWLKQGYLQLLLYSEVVSSLNLGSISEAYYFMIKELKQKGFFLDEKTTRRGKISREDLIKLFVNFELELAKILTKIKKAEFDPKPLVKKNCDNCYLYNTCRYHYGI